MPVRLRFHKLRPIFGENYDDKKGRNSRSSLHKLRAASSVCVVNAADFLQALSQRPFKPFRLILSTGREIPIVHYDTVLLNEPRTTLLAVEGERFHVVDLQHIVQLAFGGQPTSQQLTD